MSPQQSIPARWIDTLARYAGCQPVAADARPDAVNPALLALLASG